MFDDETDAEGRRLQPSGRSGAAARSRSPDNVAHARVAGHVQRARRMSALRNVPLVLALPSRARVDSFADGCRTAALDFVNRVAARDLDKVALAGWLRGPYRAHVFSPARTSHPKLPTRTIVAGVLERLVARARGEAIHAFEQARDDGPSFGFGALASGLVVRSQDVAGAIGWIPVAYPRMRLADRVASLVAADYLLRPDDYEHALFTCAACDALVFDARARDRGRCRGHARSDIRELAPPARAANDEPLAAAG
jgi:hypothetical protein